MNSLFDRLFMRGKHVCPSWLCFTFDNPLRKIFHDPGKIVAPYIKPRATVVDIGPGKGFFTVPMCQMVGSAPEDVQEGAGRVIAVDIQEKMLKSIQRRASAAGLAANLTTHLSRPDGFGLALKADFVMAFWMIHEVPEQRQFFVNVKEIMKPGAFFLIAEPFLHVTKRRFDKTLKTAQEAGFKIAARPAIPFSYAAMLVL